MGEEIEEGTFTFYLNVMNIQICQVPIPLPTPHNLDYLNNMYEQLLQSILLLLQS